MKSKGRAAAARATGNSKLATSSPTIAAGGLRLKLLWYGFMLTATDGQETGGGGTDKFRIKIWQGCTTEGAVVYDNQMGAADDAAASQALTGGSILIHAPKK